MHYALRITRWDSASIYGCDAGGNEVCIRIPEHYGDIIRLLSEGDVINVVDDIIVYQPDYLVDISSVAACFESYADTPYISLLNKLKVTPPTKAIHLGNLASQFLDEEVHGGNVDYADSVRKFFRHNALDMAASEGLGEGFHKEALAQKENIRIAVHETLEKHVEGYDASQVLLEPSFFCETLGLQGRMDLLQRDCRVLIEQKSGKGGFLRKSQAQQADPDTPIWLEKHYVQMLLYRAMLRYSSPDGDSSLSTPHPTLSFLLYSKYRNGLVPLDVSADVLHRAMMLRNKIAYLEMSYARGGAEVLLQMKPEQLRRKPMTDRFWQTWVRPEIEKVLTPIQTATPLEQAYFLRMFRFVAREHELSKMVRKNEKEENTGFAAKWHTSLDDKLMAGSIIHQLRIEECMEEEGAVTKVRLGRDSSYSLHPYSFFSHNFRLGDIVVLYAYEDGTEPDVRAGVVHRGTIEEIGSDEEGRLSVTVRLRAPQTTPSFTPSITPSSIYALEHDFLESSTTSLFRSLHKFLSAPAHRKSLLLGQRRPEFDASRKLKGDYGQFNDLVLGAMQARDYYLVVGPPGTGKTSFALLNILKEQLLQGGSVLLMAYTNRAVDEICSKLTSEGMDFLRLGPSLSCEEAYRPYLLENRSRECRNVGEIRQLVADTRIFVGTTTAITSASNSLFRLKTFALAIIDEASQILEPQLLGILSSTCGDRVGVGSFVLIGDHKQLPAVVQQSEEESRVTEQSLIDIGLTNCRNSLFERLYNSSVTPLYFMSSQGRMHADIADFPNLAFYDGKLRVAGLPHQTETGKEPRVKFIAVCSPLSMGEGGGRGSAGSPKINTDEARIIAKEVVKAIKEAGDSFDPQQTVGVIVPYRSQIAAVRNAILEEGSISHPSSIIPHLTIDTVERYQGSQRDVIIYGFTVRHEYQLKFLTSATFLDPVSGALIDRRLNVALTRARKREVIVGNPDILSQAPVFKSLIDYCKSHACYMEACPPAL